MLVDAGYTEPAIRKTLRLKRSTVVPRWRDVPALDRRLRDDRFGELVRLFLLGREADPRHVDVALLEEAGLVEPGGKGLRATARIAPFGDLLFASDRDEWDAGDDPDYVLGVTPAGVTLANATVRRPFKRALDLGTGCGLQALLAARHSDHVVGVDINERALRFADFNARLNGIENVDWRLGSLFDPVSDERFDLIVSNPPFVISPDTELTFRDSDRRGDEFCEELVRAAPSYLDDGGFATFLVSWVGAVTAPIRPWVEESGCDTWLLHTDTMDAVENAAGWNRPDRASDFDRYEQTLDRWLAYYADEGIDELSYGLIVLRKGGKGWIRADRIHPRPFAQASEHILRVFANQDLLEEHGEQALRELPLKLADSHRLSTRLELVEGLMLVETLEPGEDPLQEGPRLRRLFELGFIEVGKIPPTSPS